MREVKGWVVHWDKLAHVVAEKSKDPSTQVGAVIVDEEQSVVITGHNGMAQGIVETPEMWERPAKYDYVLHAELNAIARAARNGRPVKGCTMYVTHYPCNECAKAIVASGIKTVFVAMNELNPVWNETNAKAKKLFELAGVTVVTMYED
jgi:dCMP deaminase